MAKRQHPDYQPEDFGNGICQRATSAMVKRSGCGEGILPWQKREPPSRYFGTGFMIRAGDPDKSPPQSFRPQYPPSLRHYCIIREALSLPRISRLQPLAGWHTPRRRWTLARLSRSTINDASFESPDVAAIAYGAMTLPRCFLFVICRKINSPASCALLCAPITTGCGGRASFLTKSSSVSILR